jgi:hypothetical protein
MPQNDTRLPAWVPVVVNIFVALVLVGAFFYFYAKGNLLAYTRKGHPDWPSSDPLLDSILTGVGGIMAAIFAVALNLPRSPVPRSFRTLVSGVANVLNLVPTKPGTEAASAPPGPGWGRAESARDLADIYDPSYSNRIGLITLTAGVPRPAGGGGPNGNDFWSRVNSRALQVFAVVLVLAYPLLTIMCVVSKLWFPNFAPRFVLNFAGAGLGVLVAALAVWMSQITKGH